MMKAVVFAVFAAALAGCSTTDPIAQQESVRQAQEAQAYAPIQQNNQRHLAKMASAKAQYLKQVGPSYPYAKAVKDGVIVVGMTEAAIDAAGYACETKEQSGIGSVDACTNMVQAFSGGADPLPYYVSFDANGYVVSVQSP